MVHRAAARIALLAVATASVAASMPARGMDADEIALRTERFPPDVRAEVFAMSYLVGDAEMRDLLAYKSADRCRRWMERWWRDRDPIATSEKNEAHDEFVERIDQAREQYRSDRWPGWDQRGEVYIRYGAPAGRQKIAAEVGPDEYHRPAELWQYPAHGMLVLFEDALASGNYTYMIERVRLPAGERPRGDRKSLESDYLPGSHMDLETLDAAFNAVLNDRSTSTRGSALEFGEFRDMLLHFQEMLVSQPSTLRGDLEGSRLAVDYSVDRFRGGEGVDRVDVNVAFVADARSLGGGEAERKYVATAVFWNSDGDEVERNVHTTTVPTDTAHLVVSQLRYTLPPGFYHVAVTVEEFETGRFASHRADVACDSFDGRLAVSDVVCAGRVRPAAEESVFNRGAWYVLPHPLRRYRPGSDVPVYFEVYNLRPGRDGMASYTVSYRLIARSPRPAGFLGLSRDTTPLDVASQFTSKAAGPHDIVHITLRSGNLWKGTYVLEVTITDETSNAQVSREATFEVTDS